MHSVASQIISIMIPTIIYYRANESFRFKSTKAI